MPTAAIAVAGALGGVVELTGRLMGVQRAALLVAGALLIVSALAVLIDVRPQAANESALFARFTARFRGRLPSHPLSIGLFLGLLPCGLIYSAAAAAVSQGGPLQGAVAMGMFGLGTAPALLGLSLATQMLTARRVSLNRLSQVFVLAMGIWFVWSGLNI